jgi:hypothetical protein
LTEGALWNNDQFLDLVAMVSKALGNRTGGAHVVVLNEQCFHL